MADGTVRIKKMRLRVPGIGAADARSLGEDVARQVADNLPSSRHGSINLGALGMRVAVPEGTSQSRTASLIAEAILRGIV